MNKDLQLSINTFLNLVEVFKANGWEIPTAEAGMESRFNRFCERLSLLDKSEQCLVIELSKHFTIINANDYLQLIIKLLDRLHSENIAMLQQTQKFFILPLLAPKDFEKTKSSNFVWYYFHNEAVKYSPFFMGKALIHCDIKKASWVKNIKANETVILVDDYIGSGETAVEAVSWLSSTFDIDSKQIVILAIAAQKQGLQRITDETSATVYSYYNFMRGISDFYSGGQLASYIQTMNMIEDKLNVDRDYRFGYNRSEALISLIRTPNNTFPVFWKPYGKEQTAPFLRD